MTSWRYLTAGLRATPDVLVVGAQKAGTTSIYDALATHPDFFAARRKEVHYFDNNLQRGPRWYRAHFHLKISLGARQVLGRPRALTGEASPYYLFHPHSARRIAELIPDVRIIMMLRDPVDRAHSHYNHNRRRGREPLSFADAIELEEVRIGGALQRLVDDERQNCLDVQHFSYFERGIYVTQVVKFFEVLPRDQILVIKSEDFFSAPHATLAGVLDFLGLEPHVETALDARNVGTYAEIDPGLRALLRARYEPHNAELHKLLGVDLEWWS